MRHTDQEHRVDKQRRNTDTTIQVDKEMIATWLSFESTHNNRQRREREREREREGTEAEGKEQQLTQ
jgi:hypothetical protein